MKVVKNWVAVLLIIAFGWIISWIVSAKFGLHGWYILLGSAILVFIVLKLIDRHIWEKTEEKVIQKMAEEDMKRIQETAREIIKGEILRQLRERREWRNAL